MIFCARLRNVARIEEKLSSHKFKNANKNKSNKQQYSHNNTNKSNTKTKINQEQTTIFSQIQQQK